ncbi:5-deoxy-glucuronate isomerase [Rossellomorea sp. NS-SX7]|uniref:5-deoxy-glucuronate isomerase n=1 Tax=Rossellomorea sp. NS-SX7 TaxID=3463856 RepID=UPI004058C2B7
MSKLIVPSHNPNQRRQVMEITPESAGWEYVGFEVFLLKEGEETRISTEETEVCVVLLTGLADVRTAECSWENIGERMSIFEKIPPYAVYAPPGDQLTITANTPLQFALCKAPGNGTYGARLIKPADVGVEIRGAGNMERVIHNILPEQKEADCLLVVEVFTPEGNWSSYPPHKHDQNNLPEESYLEETYYHRVNPADGFMIQKVYTDDRALDETMTVKDGDAVLVPKGYHPVCAPPGYEGYYLNVMAGPVRTWKFRNDPNHEWLFKTKS